MSKERNLVHVVHVEDLTTIEVARTLVILEVERIADVCQIGASQLRVDLMCPCVIDFEAQTVTALLTQSNLEAVVAGGRDGSFPRLCC